MTQTNLKTLKDYIPISGVNNPAMEFAMNRAVEKFKDDLRAEAIRWILAERRVQAGVCNNDEADNCYHMKSAQEFIKHFF